MKVVICFGSILKPTFLEAVFNQHCFQEMGFSYVVFYRNVKLLNPKQKSATYKTKSSFITILFIPGINITSGSMSSFSIIEGTPLVFIIITSALTW